MRLKSEREAYLQRTHGKVGICQRKHVELRLVLLWHIGQDSRIPHCVYQNQLWWKNHILLTNVI